MSHTKGPWRVGCWSGMCKKPSHVGIMHPGPQGDDPCVYTSYLESSKGIAGPNGEMVVTTSYDELVISDDDARLIAAAPDLLEALQELLLAWNECQSHLDGVAVDAREAIAKARGAA